jgi:hypothetical protein
LKCPANAICEAGVEDGDIFQPQPKQGYWVDRAAAFRNPTLVREVYKCPRPEVCISQSVVTNSSGTSRRLSIPSVCALLKNYNSTQCASTLSCAEGSTGPLCGACEDHWRYSSVSKRCEPCSQVLNWFEAFTMIVLVVILVIIVFTIRSGDVPVPKSLQSVFGKQIHIPLIGIIYHIERGTLKVLWTTFQIIQSVSFNLSIAFPYPYSQFVSWLSFFFDLDFLSVDCFKGGYLLSVYLASAVPALLALACWVIYALRSYLAFDLSAVEEVWNQHIYTSLLIIYVFVPPVSNKQFKALDCQELADGQTFLRADTSIDCHSAHYEEFVVVDYILITFYQCLPLLYVVLLFRVRHKLNPDVPSPLLALQLRDQDETLASIKVCTIVVVIDFIF